MNKKRIWKKGPPPHAGWWNASTSRLSSAWRWWDGAMWSMPTYESESASDAADEAALWTPAQSLIEWNDYYPENARVPRVDPRHVLKITKNRAYGRLGVAA